MKATTTATVEFKVAKANIFDRIIGYFRISRFLDNFRRAEVVPNSRFRRITSVRTVE